MPKSRFWSWLSVAAWLLGGWLLSACAPAAYISLAEWPEGAELLRVTVSINGESSRVVYVPRENKEFILDLPSGARGSVMFLIEALDSGGCLIARGQWSRPISKGLANYDVHNVAKLNPELEQMRAGGWCQLSLPEVDPVPSINTVWASSPSDVWIGGDQGLSMHWNGREWTPLPRTDIAIQRIFGSSADDVWAVGPASTVLQWDSGSWRKAAVQDRSLSWLFDLWGPAGSKDAEQWSVGADGLILHSLGSAPWKLARMERGKGSLKAIWGSDARDIWAVGEHGTVLHNTGNNNWQPVTVPVPPSEMPDLNLTGVWGSAPDDVWIVGWIPANAGSGSRILHASGGTKLSSVTHPETDKLRSVWGSSARDVWAVGENGALLHWDGAIWAEKTAPVSEDLYRVSGTGPQDVWIAGEHGTLLHRTGSAPR